MLTDTMLIFDSFEQKIKVVSNAHIDDNSPDEAYREAEEKINDIIAKLRTPLILDDSLSGAKSKSVSSNFTKDDFLTAVEKSKEYVMAGDIVQVVLSQRFEREAAGDPFQHLQGPSCDQSVAVYVLSRYRRREDSRLVS